MIEASPVSRTAAGAGRLTAPLLIATSLAVAAARADAQTSLMSVPPAAQQTAALRGLDGQNQVALEIGILAGGLSYARRLGETPFAVGAGVWGAWEPPNSFDRDIFEPIGVEVFGRYRAAPWLHADLGLTAARYQWADDCSDCLGTFAGLRAVALAGRGMLWVGPEVAAGWASDDRFGSQLGVLLGAQVRLVFGWGP